MAEIQSLRCFQCKRFAYCDMFHGKHTISGYICTGCIGLMDGEIK